MGQEVELNTLHFSDPEGRETPILLAGEGPDRFAKEDKLHHLHSEKDGKFVSKGQGEAKDPERDKPTNPAPTAPPSAKPGAKSDPERTTPPGGLAKQVRAATPSREMSDDERRESLAHTPVRRSDILGGGCNETRLLELEDGTMGVYKPSRGEQGGLRAGVRGGTYYRREVGASRVASIIGMQDLVPETVFRKQGTTEGSCQEYLPGASEAAELPKKERFDGKEDASRAAAFDYLVGHLDRHSGNWLLQGDKLKLIDNGLAFPEHYSKRDFLNARFLRHAAESNLPLPDLTGLAGKWPEIMDALDESGLEPEAISLTKQRFQALTARAGLRVRDLPGPEGSAMDEVALRPMVGRTGMPQGGRTAKAP